MLAMESESKVSSFLQRVRFGDFSCALDLNSVVLTRTESGTYESDGDLWRYRQIEKYRFNINDFSHIIDRLEKDGKCELDHDGFYHYYFHKHDVLSEGVDDTVDKEEAGRIKGYFSMDEDKNLLQAEGIRFNPSQEVGKKV